MQLKNLFKDDDAVSPVIGVILMVAITVILAAVIGAFVLNLGGGQKAAPQASFEFTYAGGGVEISHAGGDTIETSQITLAGDSSDSSPNFGNVSNGWSSGEVVWSDKHSKGENVQVVWDNPESDKSNVIGEGTAN